jgi:DNA-binding MarR family transcriptional regulator
MTDVKNMPGHLIRRFHQTAVAIFHKEVAALGVDLTPVQYAALAKIEAYPGIDQLTLSGQIAYDRTTITGVVQRLVQKGWLDRQVSDNDRRLRVLVLTDNGLKVLRKVAPVVEEVQAIILKGLNKDEAAEFMRLLDKAMLAVNELSRVPMKETARSKKIRHSGSDISNPM